MSEEEEATKKRQRDEEADASATEPAEKQTKLDPDAAVATAGETPPTQSNEKPPLAENSAAAADPSQNPGHSLPVSNLRSYAPRCD